VISLIVAVSQNGLIGKQGGLPWHLPAELARFKQITMGHPIIMGRKTHESIGRALPGRQNIVISHNQDFKAASCEVVGSLDDAIQAAGQTDEIFVIGGASIYEMAISKADKVYLTRVATDLDGDKYFDFDNSNWKLISSEKHKADEKNKYDFEFQEWVKK
jgi:dihydrofolate reductase